MNEEKTKSEESANGSRNDNLTSVLNRPVIEERPHYVFDDDAPDF